MKKKINLNQFINKMKIDHKDLKMRIFHCNFLQVNTFICYDETKEAVIIDPGMVTKEEEELIENFINQENLAVKYVLNTHPHIDHIPGNAFCVNKLGAKLCAHKAGMPIYLQAPQFGQGFNFPNVDYPKPDIFIAENDEINFGNQCWKVLYTPGHADGSVCFYDEKHNFVIVGDVIFEGCIGRTDLPTGDFNLLIKNINEKILTLGDDTIIYPGHADSTTVKKEKMNNPYL